MLIKLNVDNFLSFEKETELTMIPSKRVESSEGCIETPLTPLLKYAVIYGANAAGKSNLIEAFKFLQYCVSHSIPLESADMFCKTTQKNQNRASMIEVQFTVNDNFYAYGFSAILNQGKLKSEWLYKLHENSAEVLFEREAEKKPALGKTLALSEADEARMEIYIDDFDEKSNDLFLTVMNNGKKYAKNSGLYFFKEAYDWVTKGLIVRPLQSSLSGFEYYYDSSALTVINDLLKTFDAGITQVLIEDISAEELKKELPKEAFDAFTEQIRRKSEREKLDEFKISMRSSSNFFNVEYKKGCDLKISTIKLRHGDSFYTYKFKEESEGTRRLFELIDLLLSKDENKVYIMDEMERSLHPKLTAKFMELFDRLHHGERIQLIFTTHEPSIMDKKLFRRDEIWFVERDKDNISHVYSLDKFKDRYDDMLSRAYLDGRYGAVPLFTSFRGEE